MSSPISPSADGVQSPPRMTVMRNDGPLLGVAAFACLLAGLLYADYRRSHESLWYSMIHDRNAHLYNGMTLAVDVRTANVGRLLKDLHAARVWGPLHPVMLGGVLAVGGLDPRLAVLPSLACWALTAVLAFLVARRMAPRGGDLAGAVAALLVLASPAGRAFATDVMLESMGACLSLAVLYCYLVLRQTQASSRWPAAMLGLSLTLLFFHKYNYWVLAVAPLIACEIQRRPRTWLAEARGLWVGWDGRSWLRAQVRHPLSYVLAVLLGVLALIVLHPAETLHIGSLRVSLRSPHNIISVIYAVLFIRVLPWWWRKGRQQVAAWPVVARQLLNWHVWPMLLWFLWPQRLGYFLTYLTRDHGEQGAVHPVLRGLPYYWDCFTDHYHALEWLPWAVAALAAVAFLGRLRPGSGAVGLFLLVAGGLTLIHPSLRSRFCHTWVACLWVAAGVGLAQVIYHRWNDGLSAVRPWVATAAVAVLVWLHGPALLASGRAPEGGPHLHRQPVQPVVASYLPYIADAKRATVVSNRPSKFLTGWSTLAYWRRHRPIETDFKNFGGQESDFQAWLTRTDCDTLVYVEVPPGAPLHEAGPGEPYERLPEWMGRQERFRLVACREHAAHGGVRVWVWKQ